MKLTKLPNQLTVITHKTKSKILSVGCHIGTGSDCETEENNGISHYLEHMFFKSTSNKTAKEISYEIEKIGGSVNAFTSHNQTAYYASVLAEHVEIPLKMLSDCLTNKLFLETELELERNVILQEIASYNDDPYSIADDNLMRLYEEHSYGRKILGTEENVKSFKKEDFIDYIKNNYGSNRMIVIAVGDIKHDEFVELVAKYYSHFTPIHEKNVEAPKVNSIYSHFNKDFQQSVVMYSYPTVGNEAKDIHHYELLSSYLSGGMSSPMFTEVRVNRGLVYSVGTNQSSLQKAGLFYVMGGTSDDKIEEFLVASRNELVKASSKINEDDYQRALTKTKVKLISLKESNGALRNIIAEYYFTHNKLPNFDKILNKILKISKEDLMNAAKNILKTKPSLSIVGPVKENVDYMKLLVE